MNSTASAGGNAVSGLGSPLVLTLVVLPATALLWNVISYLRDPLKSYPGPTLAKWTNLWRLYYVWRGDSHVEFQDLHKKYGPIVRIGPNLLDLDIPELVKTIYNIKGDWLKTPFYHGSSAKMNGQIVYNLFSQTDNNIHTQWRKPIAKYMSMNGVMPLEPHVDKMLEILCQQLDTRFVSTGKPCDLGKWLLYFGWDVVGTVNFSQEIGYMEKGTDFNGVLDTADKAMDYFSVVGQIPVLDYWFDKNPVYRIGPPGFGTVAGISVQHVMDRVQGKDSDYHDPNTPDFLDKFLEAKQQNPDTVDDGLLIGWLMTNLIAGADTTAISMRSVFYYGLRDPRIWKRLQAELDSIVTSTPVSWAEARSSPYLEAVMREAMRMLPGVSMTMERYVPAGGIVLPGTKNGFVPAGAVVGLNPYIIARNKSVYGEDAEAFRPERWLRDEQGGETEAAYQARLTRMNNSDLTFGGGNRICIGKNIAVLEAYKCVATLVTRYNLELVDPKSQWRVVNSWFPRQTGGLDIKFTKRAGK